MPTRGKSERKPKAILGVVSLRGYARHIGVTLKGVQKAIASGRLRECIRDGKIVDVELADREWAASRSKPANGGGHPVGETLVDAQTRVAVGRARGDMVLGVVGWAKARATIAGPAARRLQRRAHAVGAIKGGDSVGTAPAHWRRATPCRVRGRP